MNIKSKSRDLNLKASMYLKASLPYLALALIIYLLSMEMVHAEGINYLSGLKDDAKATFGNGSDIPGYIYGAEGFAGLATYIKSKSPMVFVGLPIVMIATHFVLDKAFG